MHSTLVHDIAIVLIAAGAAGWLCKCLGLSSIVGYLLAGIAIGPNAPLKLISDEASINGLAEVGLVFVMFAIGLQLGLKKLAGMGLQTIFATMLGAVFMLLLTLLLGQVLGWEYRQCLFLAAMLMVSSSAVIAKVMQELHLTHDKMAQTALGITISEDVVAVVMLTILATVTSAAGDAGGGGIVSGVGQVGSVFTSISSFVILVLASCLLFVPRLVRRLELSGDPDLRNVGVAGLLLILAFSAREAGFSLALGAFLFGAIIAELPQKDALEKSFDSVRSIFSSLFFVSIGMMADPRSLFSADVLLLTGVLLLFTMLGRPVACGLAMLLTGSPPNAARRSGLLLTPLGEFTFLIAQLAVSAKVFEKHLYPVAILLSVLTVLATPFMNRHADVILRVAMKLEPRFITRLMALYHVWLEKLKNRPPRGVVWKLVAPKLLQSFLELLLATGIVIFLPQLQNTAREFFERIARKLHWGAAGGGELVLQILFWSVTGIMVTALWWSIWRNAKEVIPPLARSFSSTFLPRQLLASAFWVLFVMVSVIWLTLLLPAWFSTFSAYVRVLPFLLLLAAVVGAGLYFSRQLTVWRKSVEDALARDGGAGQGGDPVESSREGAWNRFAGELGSWDIHLQDCVLPENAACAGESLRKLSIPSRFGASVVSIDRNGFLISSPGPETRLYPGDRLSLLGKSAEIQAARQFLGERRPLAGSPASQPILETCIVPPGPSAGKSLAELRLGDVAAIRVAGIQRDGRHIVNPSGSEILHPGDSLLVMAEAAQFRKFEKWLASTSVHAATASAVP
ncbi:MAG: cation:proton antiporter [Puniceicoccales bacterium]|jgi:CPA2 family monovalent cation:H+ antiporter-2|nr:cation:proton antiporter [Puniceicoccales bacterium]